MNCRYNKITWSFVLFLLSLLLHGNVYGQLAAGTISPGTLAINYNSRPSFTTTAASGGSGYAYQWQSSPDNSTWTDVSGQTAASFTTGNLYASIYYRRGVTSAGVTLYSNAIAITVYPQLTVTVTPSVSINYHTQPAMLMGTVSGGNQVYTYQWYKAETPYNTGWTLITGATTVSYQPDTLNMSTEYKLAVTSNGVTVNSGNSVVTVYGKVTAGTAAPAISSVNYNAGQVMTVSGYGGGAPTKVYKWQKSGASDTTWRDIANSSTATLNTGALKERSYFRFCETSNGITAYSNAAEVDVYPQLVTDSIMPVNSMVYYDNRPGQLTGTEARGGAGPGSYVYQWQKAESPYSSGYNDIPGANTMNYTHDTLTITTKFRRGVTSNGATVYSNIATVTVYGQLTGGVLSPANYYIDGSTSPGSIKLTGVNGGSGAFTYQWQTSGDNVNWTNIANATVSVYTPPVNLTATTFYRVMVSNNGVSVYSSTATLFIANCQSLSSTPSGSMNYVLTNTIRKSGITDPASIAGQPVCNVAQTVQYIDGLGRPVQTVQVKGSPDQMHDIISPVEYDGYGRETKKYNPYADLSSNPSGSFRAGMYADQANYYSPSNTNVTGVVRTDFPFSQSNIEFSPLNRVLEQGAPGRDWQPGNGHTVRADWGNNDAQDMNTGTGRWARFYATTIDATGAQTLVDKGAYPPGGLYVTITKDENWITGKSGTQESYTDRRGHLILKRVWRDETTPYSTYYVYDDFGNLAFVLPPGASPDGGGITPAVMANFCYQYRYDERGRLTAKQIPGKDWDLIVYNSLDQPVLTQDGNQRLTNQWTVTKYDAQGRAVMTGLWNAGSLIPQATLQASIYGGAQWDSRDYLGNTASNQYKYVINSYPAITTILSINYYDSYIGLSTSGVPSGYTAITTGLLTGSRVAVLNKPVNLLLSMNYYDDKARLVTNYAMHYLNLLYNNMNYDVTTNIYSFTGETINTVRQHFNAINNLLLNVVNAYTYDHVGRKTQTFEQIGADPKILLSQLDYNDIGQLRTKRLHNPGIGSAFVQQINYAYNERGWLTNINNPDAVSNAAVFGEQLQYNTGTAPQFNGNISGVAWQTMLPSTTQSTQQKQSYAYSYDPLNRVTLAAYTTPGTENKFNETVTYDPMGNIQTLKRSNNAVGYSNDFTYDYTSQGAGNKLWAVSDAGTLNQASMYAYDANGNVKQDSRNQITNIDYNLLNLPQTVTRGPGNIVYTYNAAGQKLVKVSGSTTRSYVNGIEYNNGAIEFIQTEEGRAVSTGGGSYGYEYYLKDHLGNIRAAVTATGTISQVQDYYAFGMEMNANTSYTLGLPNQYTYNGKELQNETGQYDYGARFYDPVIGRWTTVDPDVEDGQETGTPYGYVFNDPIRLTDPNGRKPCCGVLIGGTAGGAAGGIFAASLVAGGTVAAGSTATIVGAPVGWVVGGGIVLGGAIGAGAVWLWDHAHNSESTEPEHTTAPSAPEKVKSPPNPDGAKGKPDHQQKVDELAKKAQAEAKPGETVVREKKIQHPGSNRRPDVQVVDENGNTTQVHEAERKPNSTRNKKREAEYKKLNIPNQTHPVGQGQ